MARFKQLLAGGAALALLCAAASLSAEPYNPEADAPEAYNPEAEYSDAYNSGQDAEQPYNPEADAPGMAQGKAPKALPPIQCDGVSVCREPDTGLPARVLVRAFSKVYTARKVDDALIARETVAALKPLYVFAREEIDLRDPADPKGWYRIAESETGQPLGWVRAADAIEWRQALVVAYTHPGFGEEERQRVLMFEYLEDLQDLTEADEREEQALAVYQMLDEGRGMGIVVSKEPERFVNIAESFYLLPIVDHQMTDIDGDEARYLRLAAAVPEARGADTLANEEYRQQAQQKGALDASAKKKLNVDIVFVIDMSRSMQPYIDNTRKAVTELTRTLIAKEGLEDRVRFGLVGFRDSVEKMPALEFTAKNFTPSLIDAGSFTQLVRKQARATRIGSKDYEEEVYAGVDMAISETAWRENSLRFLVLIGDASAHEPGHPQSTTQKNAEVLKLSLQDSSQYLLAMHLRDYRMGRDHPIAEQQFSTLAKVPGSEEVALVPVDLDEKPDYKNFKNAVASVSKTLLSVLQEQAPAQADESGATEQQATQAASALVNAALVEYLGQEAEPPKDIMVWALDRDLTNPTMRSLEVRVLITKSQLSSLIQALDRVMTAMQKQQQEQIKLFEALQSVASATMKNPDQIASAEKLAETGLLPKFIEALPYRSEILSLTEDAYASLTADQRAALEASLMAKLFQYRDINEQVDGWVKLNPSDADSSKVYPLHLSYLP